MKDYVRLVFNLILCVVAEDQFLKEKIALFTNVLAQDVVVLPDVPHVYSIPSHLVAEGVHQRLQQKLNTTWQAPDLSQWQSLLALQAKQTTAITIGLLGKYVALSDAYKSVIEALQHAAMHQGVDLSICYLQAEDFDQDAKKLPSLHGLLIPGGFGHRGVRGKINAVRYVREHRIPCLAICLGLQVAVIEAAQHLLALPDAQSTEFDPATQHPVISLVTEWQSAQGQQTRTNANQKGGTMRLGGQDVTLTSGSRAAKAYGTCDIRERHRHRYEVNPGYLDDLEKVGWQVTGRDTQAGLVEVMEYADHPWFVACQYHPEFLSRPHQPIHCLWVLQASFALLNSATASKESTS